MEVSNAVAVNHGDAFRYFHGCYYLPVVLSCCTELDDARLHVASHDFHHRLTKKTPCDAIEDNEKYLPVDALGIVMLQHGEEFGSDSAFGELIKDPSSHQR